MASSEGMEDWSVEQVEKFISAEFCAEIAQNFKDEEVDGPTLLMLGTTGSSDHMKRCGLTKLKEEMKLRRIIQERVKTPGPEASSPTTSVKTSDMKLSKRDMSMLRPEEKQTYLIKRNRVRAAAALAWPGNEIPTFKNNKENAARLDQLVMELLPDCSYSPLSLPGVCFSRNGIRQHILDTLNERRRRVHGGYDYEKPPTKRVKTEGSVKKEEPIVSETSVQKEQLDATSEDEVNGCDYSEFDEADWKKRLSSKSAEVVLIAAFEAHRFKDIGRGQLLSAIKNHCSDQTAKSMRGVEKTSLTMPLAAALMAKNIVQIKEGADLKNLSRQDVTKVGTF